MGRAARGNPLCDNLLGGDGAAPLLLAPDGAQLSRAQFAALSARLAARLLALGARRGDRLLCQAQKSPQMLALCLACMRIGVIFVPLNPAYTRAELEYFIGDARPSILVCDGGAQHGLRPLARQCGATLRTLDADGSGALTAGLDGEAQAAAAPCGADDPACMLYTSGTTGRPKGAVLSHGNLLANARTLAALWRFSADDVLLHALPIFHLHGLFAAAFTMLAARAAMLFVPRFDAAEVARLLPRATAMMGVPTHYTRLLALPEAQFGRATASGMRLFISGSAPLLAATHAAFEQRTGHRILERYGMSETGIMASNPLDGERRPGAVGMPLPDVQLRIADEQSGAMLPGGQTGIIEARGPGIFGGYWQMPDKTRAAHRPDGFFITGDLGRFDNDGYLHIVGRTSDTIITGGLNLYPSEVEAALNALPDIAESAVVAAPHPDLGEAAVAFVVPQPGATPDAATTTQTLRKTLAPFKIPKRIIPITALPRNTMGKVQKTILRTRCRTTFPHP